MSDPIRKESPLAARLTHRAVTERAQRADVIVSERPFLGHINLRGDPSDAGFLDAIRGALGCDVPRSPNTFVDAGPTRVLWLGPDEWLIVTEETREDVLAANLRDSLRGRFCAVTEIGSGQTVITLAGGRARDVVAQGCSLDLHPKVFDTGRCAQTRLAKAGIVIAQTDRMPTFELVVRRSFADYLWLWLTDAAAEFG